jgi:SAM-dependent methyltransferase
MAMGIIDPDFRQKALAHWTPEREAKVTGGRRWPLLPSEAPELLRVLSLLNADATMSADAMRKFSQVNHMVTLLLPVLKDLMERHKVLRIFDAGCGTSALTLILAWILKIKEKHPCRLVGMDQSAAVITTSTKRAEALGLSDVLRFRVGQLHPAATQGLFAEAFPEDPAEKKPLRPHLLLGLHACDTATDMALAMGIIGQVDAMAIAPCCHAELAKIWKEASDPAHPFAPVFAAPHIRRETASHLTDALRMVMVRGRGYEVTATEFVPSIHTPKNRLLLAVRRGRFHKDAMEQYERLKGAIGGTPLTLEKTLTEVDLQLKATSLANGPVEEPQP